MPRLSLYKPEKGADFRFLDRVINEEFQVGGTDIFIHKYLGPAAPAEGESSPGLPQNSNPIPELGIQDLIFMENRDRVYEPDIYQVRGIYTMQDIDFNLTQFGLFLSNDNIMVTFHLRSTIDTIGRKIMAGDVLELPHLKDEYALDDSMVALKRFYVITDVVRAATGFSQTWYPHLLRAKCQPLVDSQEFKDIIDREKEKGGIGTTYDKNIEINKAIVAQAEADAPLSGYNTKNLFVLPINENGLLNLADVTDTDADASTEQPAMDASMVLRTPDKNVYVGYMTNDAIPPNGAPYTFGITFPNGPVIGQFHLRNDFFPNRLFRYNGTRWIKFEDNVRMTLDNFGNENVAPTGNYPGKDVRLTKKGTFINNNNTSTIAGNVVQEKQALSKALKPKADN
jgi:hypothetical protein